GARGLEADSERAARPVALGDDEEPDHFSHRQRDETEVVADDLEARAGIGHHEGEEHRDQDGDRRARPRRQPEEVPQEHGGVGAHAEEGAVTEGDEAEASHQGPRIADERPQEDLDDDVPDVLLRHAEGQRGHQRDREEDDAPDGAPTHQARLAKMPPGRTKISTMKMTKAMT